MRRKVSEVPTCVDLYHLSQFVITAYHKFRPQSYRPRLTDHKNTNRIFGKTTRQCGLYIPNFGAKNPLVKRTLYEIKRNIYIGHRDEVCGVSTLLRRRRRTQEYTCSTWGKLARPSSGMCTRKTPGTTIPP